MPSYLRSNVHAALVNRSCVSVAAIGTNQSGIVIVALVIQTYAMPRFKAKLEPVPGGGHYVVVPDKVADAAKLRYGARVRGTVDGVAYRSSLMKYSGVFHLGVHKATIAAAAVKPGDTIDVSLELDDKP